MTIELAGGNSSKPSSPTSSTNNNDPSSNNNVRPFENLNNLDLLDQPGPGENTESHRASLIGASQPKSRSVWCSSTRSNWAGNVTFTPQRFEEPKSIDELKELLKTAKEEDLKVSVVASGHSFSQIANSKGMIISLRHLPTPPIELDDSFVAKIPGHMKLSNVVQQLWRQGRCLANQGDTTTQGIVGATATGTHGTGINLGSMSTQIEALTILTTEGVERRLVKDDPDFEAAQMSLGAMGVITEVEVRTVPSFYLSQHRRSMNFTDALDFITDRSQTDRSELWLFPHKKDKVNVQTLTEHEIDNRSRLRILMDRIKTWWKESVIEDFGYSVMERLATIKFLRNRIADWLPGQMPVGTDFGEAPEIFHHPRSTKFIESEYAVPLDSLKDTLEKIIKKVEEKGYKPLMPLEVRIVASDSIPLSPFNGSSEEKFAMIAVHDTLKASQDGYLRDIEKILIDAGGKPHWGKMSSLSSQERIERFGTENVSRFKESCSQLDPSGTMWTESRSLALGDRGSQTPTTPALVH